MATLEPRADKAVRDAVDAFMDGRFVPEFVGETVFETKNSRYRLVDGVVFSAPDASLFGAELVGWLRESPKRCLVESLWQPGSRAVLVDRRNERSIIVTSTTRLLHAEEPGSSPYRGGSPSAHSEFRSWHPPPPRPRDTPLPPFSPRSAPIVASTPPPQGVLPTPPPPAPIASAARATPIPMAAASAPHAAAPAEPALSPPAPRPSAPRPSAPRRGVHAPPRPIGVPAAAPSRPSAGPTPVPPARPLPLPTPPPRRESPRPDAAPPPAAPFRAPAPPSVPSEWELTSAEIEIEPDTAEPMTVQRPPAQGDAPRNAEGEPVNSVPFPLVRPT